jgi:hypothetical protein
MRARLNGVRWQPLNLRCSWLVPVAVIPQLLIFNTFLNRLDFSDSLAGGILVITLGLLLVFVLLNKKTDGFGILGVGLGMNFLVILLNGGLMPISPETVSQLVPNIRVEEIQPGLRYLGSKDIILLPEATRLWLLSDLFLTPQIFSWRYAFSIGDVFIATGVFLSLLSQGGSTKCLVDLGKMWGKNSSNQNRKLLAGKR